jgi:hypothetical protein
MWRRKQIASTGARKSWHLRLYVVLPALATILFLPGASVYYRYSNGRSCAACHEIWQPYTDWHTSTHRDALCSDCHGDVLTLNAGFHLKHMRQLFSHLRGEVPEQVRLQADDVQQMSARCGKCHREEYADWAAGPHAVTYKEIFLDETHNRKQHLADDCLRCHGMHYQGGMRDLLTRTDTQGPWSLRDAKLSQQNAIPCLACHQLHREGNLLSRVSPKPSDAGPKQEIARPSIALYDRREQGYVALDRLSLPPMVDGQRIVRISPDIRQALCYQCHAPLVTEVVGSGDDRTTVGVHEGLSCFACHERHGMKTRASCSTCHPQLSNCGLNVETMDTSFKDARSPHNIHFVKCVDCHKHGVPQKKVQPRDSLRAYSPAPSGHGLIEATPF